MNRRTKSKNNCYDGMCGSTTCERCHPGCNTPLECVECGGKCFDDDSERCPSCGGAVCMECCDKLEDRDYLCSECLVDKLEDEEIEQKKKQKQTRRAM